MIIWKIEVLCDSDFDPCWELVGIVDSAEVARSTLKKKRAQINSNDGDTTCFGRPSDVWQHEDEITLTWWNKTWKATPETVHDTPLELP